MSWRIFCKLIIPSLSIKKFWVCPLIPDRSHRRKVRELEVIGREHWFKFIIRVQTEEEVVRENCLLIKPVVRFVKFEVLSVVKVVDIVMIAK